MEIFDEETKRLRKQYEEKYRQKAPGINYDEYDNLENYKEYLEKMIKS